ncbi:MAG: hypothetical protein QM756_18120 [Polyangiaceae bacterium]
MTSALRLQPPLVALAAGLGLVLSTVSGHAAERHFAFSQESNLSAPGESEVLPSTSAHIGRHHYYNAIQPSLGFALGLGPNLQTALYWSFETTTERVSVPNVGYVYDERFRFGAVSSEWRYKLSDALADRLGSALQLSVSYGPSLLALEGKLILDEQIGNFRLAANLSGAQLLEFRPGHDLYSQWVRGSLAAGYFLTPALLFGVEAQSSTLLNEGNVEASTIYAGPTLAYLSDRYWLVASVAPQVFAPKSDTGSRLDLTTGEYVWARLLLGFRP